MKVICFFICIFFAGASYSQKKSRSKKKVMINGIGVILLGKTEQDIVHDLQWDSLQIINGNNETKDEFRKSITAAVVRVQYNSGSVLARDLQLQTEDTCTGPFEPESHIHSCSDVVEFCSQI